MDAYNAECDAERKDATHLEALRREAIDCLREVVDIDDLSEEDDATDDEEV